MTQDEQLVLAKGRVPAQPILAAVIEHIKAHDDGLVNGPYLEVISEKSGQPLQTLMVWTSNPARCPTLPFDVADRLLCATHLWGMWFGELREYYERVDLTWYQCAHPSCLVTFQRHFVRCSFKGCMTGAHARGLCHKHLERVSYHARKEAKETGVSLAEILDRDHPKTGHSGKAAEQMYCSHECATSHGKQKRAGVEHGNRFKHYRPGETCMKGHKWTRENTMILKGGKRRCRSCHNATSNKSYAQRKVAA